VDGAGKIGAKILVSGGGRCNVTHDVVDVLAFAGSSRHAIRKVLLRFDVPRTVAFFEELGVTLKREEGGKLFPVDDRARSVLNSLLRAANEAGAEVRHPWRVEAIRRGADGFVLTGSDGELRARRVILATGGKSLPRSGSDGAGFALAQSLGHTLTPRLLPALVPLTLPPEHFLCGLSGVAVPATIELRASSGKRLAGFTDSILCTHFGLSGPGVLDVSRYYLDAVAEDPEAHLVINWLPGETRETLDRWLRSLEGRSPVAALSRRIPERLARALGAAAGLSGTETGATLTRETRTAFVRAVTELRLPITGSRGFRYAEVTAGGVPLGELRLQTMESRICPGLHLCGEILDVDGRIGGYNFQWAWASGYVAGWSAAASVTGTGRSHPSCS
jgi:predicted Rossmann fold flavoprotein